MPNTENQYIGTDLGNVAPNPKGEYSTSEEYEYLDTVSYKGGSYMCVADTVTGTAPVAGENTDIWQMLTLPGGLTPEYVAMHDNVASKAIQVESSRAVVEQAQQEVEAAQADVQQLHSDTVAASQSAEASRDSAAGYAQASEASRTAAEEAESNVNALVNGFDDHVTQQITKAEDDITKARQQAVSAVESQQDTSVQYVKDQTTEYTEAKKKEISDTTETVKKTVEEAGANQIKSIADSLDKNLDTEGKAADAGATGKAIGEVKKKIENANKDIKELADKKITKFYASNQGETHLADSDNGKIMDMMVYGRSEQKKYNGYQLFIPKNKTFTSEGVTVTYSEDGIITLNGTATGNVGVIGYLDIQPDTKLRGNTELLNDPNVNFWIYTMADSYKTIYVKNFGDYFTTDSDITPKRVAVSIGNSTGIVFENTKIRLTIAEGTERKSWEPYTGGIPSPNPDYPQEIKGVVNPTVRFSKFGTIGGNLSKEQYDYLKTEYSTFFTEKYVLWTLNGIINIVYDYEPGNNRCHLKRITKDGTISKEMWNSDILDVWTGKRERGYFLHANNDYIKVDASKTLGLPNGEYGIYESITLPYTLNAIPVSSGGNITVDGQQYIADYVDVERGKLVRRVYEYVFSGEEHWTVATDGAQYLQQLISNDHGIMDSAADKKCLCSCLSANTTNKTKTGENYISTQYYDNVCRIWISADVVTSKLTGEKVFLALTIPEEISLTTEEIQAFKSLATYYSATNISVISEQLDGYTVFNYPVSLENGWNYVKQQINDNRDYIYDMDNRVTETEVATLENKIDTAILTAMMEG